MAGSIPVSVFFVTRKFPPAVGGMETYCRRLTEELAQLAQLELVALPGTEDGNPPGAMKLVLFPFKVLVRWLSRSRPPDILHLGDMAIWPFAMLCFLSRKRTRVVLSAHGTDVSYHRRQGLKGRLYGLYLKIGARLLPAATVIANSRATEAAAAETGWRVAKVIPLATDMAGAVGECAHKGRLLFAGRLVPRKGLSWFVREVLPALPATIILDVAGTAWARSERTALEHPQVNYLGVLDQEQLARAYREALCVILPNIAVETGEYEGFGLIAPEAAAAGGVVLAAARDGLTDAVIDGETGFLVGSGNAEAWRAMIIQIAAWSDDCRAEFTTRAMAKASEHFSWSRVAREVLDSYLQETIKQAR